VVRIVGVDLPNNKRLVIGLTYIFGVGPTVARELLDKTGIDPDKRVSELTEAEIAELRKELENDYVVEGDLRRKVRSDIQRLKEIKSYRGGRHTQGLPSRGQKTRSNARTWKGPRPAKAGKRK